MLDDRAFTFLDIASRDTTAEGEAIVALRHFRKALDSSRIDLREYFSGTSAAQTPGSLSLAKYKQRVSELETELETVTLEKDSLLSSNLSLTRQLRQAEKQVRLPKAEEVDEHAFVEFDRAVTAKVGKKWRAVMLAQTRYTYADFRNWEIDKKAPPEAFACIDDLRAVKATSFKWDENPDAVKRVFELKESGFKTKAIAETLSAELGFELLPTAIKYCIQLKKAA